MQSSILDSGISSPGCSLEPKWRSHLHKVAAISYGMKDKKDLLATLACTISGSLPSYPYSLTNANVPARSMPITASPSKAVLLTDHLTPLTLFQVLVKPRRDIISRQANKCLPVWAEAMSVWINSPCQPQQRYQEL
jgi:hypothetical protein